MEHFLFKPLLVTSISASTFVAGCQLSLSNVSVSMILDQPNLSEATSLSQFKTLFLRGFRLCPLPSIFSALCCASNAGLAYYKHGSITPTVSRLSLAAALMVGLIPFTLAFVLPTEEKILKRAARFASGESVAKDADKKEEDTRALMEKWSVLNYARTLFPVAGVVVAWTLL
ncbi:uncharacterized protein GGS25DRAFT_526193 [Hypoxylon fragiforme]|uniref:uncharacterized protein n=1 Tax=Hypoxylon fragiforme TaxID=63214 RepID=UPI0020C687EE|nr:uncharacterized protein GGS25DRAFT_526193 [Hypoxylon fragiforme]KAI2603152.1 hypothetical protein GGS25DRAFT_526193 [Hypoxylon fragiforme]